MKKFFKINAILLRNAWIRDSKISGFIISNIFAQLLDLTVSLVFIWIIFLQTETIGGWDVYQLVFLLSFIQLVATIHSCSTKSGSNAFAYELVRQGDYDFYLTKPFDSMILVTISKPRIYPIAKLIFEILIMAYALNHLERLPLSNYLWFFVLFILSVFIFYFLKVLTILPTFWTIKGWSLTPIMDKMVQLVKYPASVYPKIFALILSTVFPILIVSYLPVQFLFFEPKIKLIIFSFVVAIIFGALTRLLWWLGEKNYGSASS